MFHNSQQIRHHGRGRGGYGRGRGGGRGGRNNGGRRNHNNYQNKRNHHHNNNNNNHNQFNVNDDIVNVEEVGTYEDEQKTVRIAIQGCCHGSIERIYDMLEACEKRDEKKIDLLICCGDFQSLRNTTDFQTMAVPPKYRDIGTFHKYYSGVKRAPILTLFVGGNHEASAYLQELYYGGWVAPNIYYLGAAGVVRFRGLRIAGVSGIYKNWDYRRGRFEFPPYNNSTLRSVYHVRNVEVARLKCLSNSNNVYSGKSSSSPSVDIMVSHDWPRGVEQHGDLNSLLRRKKHFRDEVQTNTLGSPSNEELLNELKPKWWFAAHLHVKFIAHYKHTKPQKDECKSNENHVDDNTTSTMLKPSQIFTSAQIQPSQTKTKKPIDEKQDKENKDDSEHEDFIALPKADNNHDVQTAFIGLESSSQQCLETEDLTELMTKFLSLDKCLPRKHHLQIINIPSPEKQGNDDVSTTDTKSSGLHYDLEWLAIIQKSHKWLSSHNTIVPDPNISSINMTKTDLENIEQRLKDVRGNNPTTENVLSCATQIPNNFCMTLQPYGTIGANEFINGGRMVGNPQTDELLDLLGLDHIITIPYVLSSSNQGGVIPDKSSENFDQGIDMNEIDIDDDDGCCDKVENVVEDSNEINIDEDL